MPANGEVVGDILRPTPGAGQQGASHRPAGGAHDVAELSSVQGDGGRSSATDSTDQERTWDRGLRRLVDWGRWINWSIEDGTGRQDDVTDRGLWVIFLLCSCHLGQSEGGLERIGLLGQGGGGLSRA